MYKNTLYHPSIKKKKRQIHQSMISVFLIVYETLLCKESKIYLLADLARSDNQASLAA